MEVADVSTPTEAGYAVPSASFDGEATSAPFRPAAMPLWLTRVEVGATGRLTWAGDHGDEALFVVAGTVDVDGATCPAGGAVVVEAGCAAVATVHAGSTVVHVGAPVSGDGGPPARSDTVHVVGPKGTYAIRTADRDTHFFADSTCDGCRITLFYTGRTGRYRAEPHRHSEDEILYVLHGGIAFGRQEVPAGTAVAVPGGHPYGFVSPAGFGMLNYRRDASTFSAAGALPFTEGGRATGMPYVGDVIHPRPTPGSGATTARPPAR